MTYPFHKLIDDTLINLRAPERSTPPHFRRTATRADLLDAVEPLCPGLTRHQTREVLESALEEVSQALSRGEHVKLRSFGLFAVREKRGRVGRNPRTGEQVEIKPRRVLTFKPSPVLMDLVNQPQPQRLRDEQ